MSSRLPRSTTRPAYMTSTRSAMSATTPRSWVTKITPLSLSALSCLTSSRIWAWIVTSSAVVGSSAISRLGDSDSAIARARDPHALHQLDGAVERLGLADPLVRADLLDDLVADAMYGAQRRDRVLEDHRDLRAADP